MLSKQLADFICHVNYANLSEKTVQMTELAFLDWLGSAVAGGQKEPAQKCFRVIRALGGVPQATLPATGEKTSCINAALANGVSSHIIELDDVHKASILHAGAAVIPAALAVAEMTGAGGRQLITAIVVGYEIAIRVGESVTPSHYYFWHTTGTCGTFGAAAAAGKLLGLNPEQMVWALGNAGTQAAGLWEFLADGAMSKHLHPGKAAQNGVLAALMAREDFTGASRILEGEKGFCRATAPRFDLNKITDGLGQSTYKIEENSFKIHSSCRHTHPAVDVTLDLVKRYGIRFAEVKDIAVGAYKTALDITDNHQPANLYAAKFSLPFCVVLALKAGHCNPDDFSEENLFDLEIRGLMPKVTLNLDPQLNALHPERWPATVKITTRSGQVYEGRTDYPRGDPENPVTVSELAEKFKTLVMDIWGETKVKRVIETILALDKVEQITQLFE